MEGAESFIMQTFLPLTTCRFRMLSIERPKADLKLLLQQNGCGLVRTLGNFGEEIWGDWRHFKTRFWQKHIKEQEDHISAKKDQEQIQSNNQDADSSYDSINSTRNSSANVFPLRSSFVVRRSATDDIPFLPLTAHSSCEGDRAAVPCSIR